MAIHAQNSVSLNTKPAKTSLLGGHFIYRVDTSQGTLTPSSANIIENVNDSPALWGYNTHIGAGGIKLRYNQIDLSTWTKDGVTLYYPKYNSSNVPIQGDVAAILNTTGLKVQRGGVIAGTAGQNGFVYLSSEGYQLKDATHNGLTINGHTPTAAGTDGKLIDDPAWREIIGTKFGVDSEGNLYASNASIEGAITATSLTIGSGVDAYDAISTMNVSRYTIAMVEDSDNASIQDDNVSTYLYPILYYNGVQTEPYVLSEDTSVVSGKEYYSRSGNTYTEISNPTGNPSENEYYEIDYTRFIWYQDESTTGTIGNANDGGIIAFFSHTYRVVFSFNDMEVGQASSVQQITIDPSKYITRITDTGITIHPEVWTNESSYIQLDGNGMELFNSEGNSIAEYGSIARIGLDESSRFLMNSGSLQAYDGNNNKYFEVNSNGAQIGVSNKAHTTIDEDGMQIYSVDGNGNLVELANIGYGEGNAYSGIAFAPYYTIGIRASDSEVGNYSIAEGNMTTASGHASHAEGSLTKATQVDSHAEGKNTTARGFQSHAEGESTFAEEHGSHAEGLSTIAFGDGSHAEGGNTTARGIYSHAEGKNTIAYGNGSHAEGYNTTVGTKVTEGVYSHAEGYNTEVLSTSGKYAHVQNEGTTVNHRSQTALGTYNWADSTRVTIHPSNNDEYGKYVVLIGNGTNDDNRSCALTVDWSGNTVITGTLTQSSDRRLKDHQSYLSTDAVNFIQNLKPTYFKKDNQFHVGFYAQDVEEIDPWHCMTGEMNGFKTLGYTEIIAPLVAYCQHLEERIKQLEEK